MSYKKTLQEMNLLDRFLFAEVMEDNETLENVLEIIQGYPVTLEDKAQAEKELRRTPRNKRVFFDVYGEDLRNAVYDVEAQKENTHDSHPGYFTSAPAGHGAARLRRSAAASHRPYTDQAAGH